MRIAFRLILFILATLVHYSAGQSFCGVHNGYQDYNWDGSQDVSEITDQTVFESNLGRVYDSVILFDKEFQDDIKKYGWFDYHKGEDPNAVYTQGRCIGYVDYDTCLGCIQDAIAKLQEDCSQRGSVGKCKTMTSCRGIYTSAIIWFPNQCMVRYSNHDMNGTVAMPDNMIFVSNRTLDVLLDPNAFNAARTKLFNALSSTAKGRPDGYMMFSAGKWYDVSSKETIYGAAQCSPDLHSNQCSACLDTVGQKLGEYFDGKVSGSIVGPSCNFQYDNKSFINDNFLVFDNLSPSLPPPPASSPQQLPPPPSTGEGANKALRAIYILAPLIVTSIIIFVGIYLFLKKKKHKKPTTEVEIVGRVNDEDEDVFEPGIGIMSEETLQYDFSTISAATENFSKANMLGQGGFGAVYKGKFQDGEEIAVKRLSQTSGQGEVEFANEVTLLSKLQHRNLVRLLGFCLKKKERLLVYEFVANSSLDNYIFDPIKRVHLNWDRLYKIIIGVARGLLYLHEDSRLRIIHRDLKSSNILLDNEMTPKIADFGMARLFQSDETHGSTSKIVGTYGYMAPEYAMYGQFSIKSDVFSFGVLLIEIICGRRNTFFRIENSVEDLLSYGWKNYQEGTIINLLDPALKLEANSTCEITRCIHIGLLCTQEDDTQRPTMAYVFHLLSNLSIALPIPSKPAFFQQRSINQGTPLLQDSDPGQISNSSGSKNKSSMSWSTDTVLRPR